MLGLKQVLFSENYEAELAVSKLRDILTYILLSISKVFHKTSQLYIFSPNILR